jgi:hypothetical protein
MKLFEVTIKRINTSKIVVAANDEKEAMVIAGKTPACGAKKEDFDNELTAKEIHSWNRFVEE